MSLRLAVLGATGRMGRMVTAEIEKHADLSLVAAVASGGSKALGADIHTLCGLPSRGILVRPPTVAALAGCDAVIDFSLPHALEEALPMLGSAALVSGTTGLSESQRALLDRRAQIAPVLWASNFSLGVTLLLDLAARAAAALPDADIEIVETHHRHKRDAPSGTALSLAEAVSAGRKTAAALQHGRQGLVGERTRGPIGMHALRGGDVVGEHTVWLLSDGERLSLGHSASSRSTFAAGAVRAAHFLAGRAARRYSLREVLGLEG